MPKSECIFSQKVLSNYSNTGVFPVPSPWSCQSGDSGCQFPGPCPRPCGANFRWCRPPAPGSHPSHSLVHHPSPWSGAGRIGVRGLVTDRRLLQLRYHLLVSNKKLYKRHDWNNVVLKISQRGLFLDIYGWNQTGLKLLKVQHHGQHNWCSCETEWKHFELHCGEWVRRPLPHPINHYILLN